MELIKTQHKIRCELGACRRPAEFTIKLDRVGIRSRIHVCTQCLQELYKSIGETIIPKSIETAVKRTKQKREKENE